jgi:hypothetical protein
MIIWDNGEPYGPRKGDRCVFCRGPLHPPLVMWHAPYCGDDDAAEPRYEKFICSECCIDMRRGLSLDLKRMGTAKAVERLGFDRAARRAAVSGGLLYTMGTNNKQ